MYQFIERFQHIVIEGPIGVGKTSLASKLAPLAGAGLILENTAQNPFLEKFYASQGRSDALATQLYFYFQRLDHLRNNEIYRQHKFSVGDYMFEKNNVFAHLTLNQHEQALYRRVSQEICDSDLLKPGLVIWLQAPVPTLLARIRQRGIGMEKVIHEDYLEQLSQAYSRFFQTYKGAPVFAVNTEKLNPIDNETHFSLLVERLNSFRGDREFFNPQA